MKSIKWLAIIAIVLSVLIVSSILVLAGKSDDIRRVLGLSQIPMWHPGYDSNDVSDRNNLSYRVLIKFYNNGTNVTNPNFNESLYFPEMLYDLGLGPQLYSLSSLQDNIMCYYSFNNNITSDDFNNFDLIYSTGTTTTYINEGKVKEGVHFYTLDSQSVLLNSNLTNLSIVGWVKKDNNFNTYYDILFSLKNTTNATLLQVDTDANNRLRLRVDGNNIYLSTASFTGNTANFSDGSWHFVALTLSQTNQTQNLIRLYFDGSQINSSITLNDSISTDKKNFMINFQTTYGGNFTYDEVMLLNKTLSPTEVDDLYARGSQTQYYVDTNSIRIYEFNQWGACVNESGIYNTTCGSLAWNEVA